MKLPAKTLGVLVGLLFSVCSNGAAAVTFYSETRDAQAQAVKDAWSKVDLKAVIEIPRANLSSLFAQQAAAISDSAAARQAALVQMISFSNMRQVGVSGGDTKTLFGQLDALLDRNALVSCEAQLGAKPCSIATVEGREEWRRLLAADAIAQAQLDALKVRYQRISKPSSCTKPGDDSDLSKKCEAAKSSSQALGKFNPNAAWVQAQNKADIASTELADALEKANKLREEIASDLKAVSRDSGSTDKEFLAAVSEAAARLKKNLQNLLHLQNNDVFHFELLSQLKQDSLNAFLTTLADAKDGVPPPATSPKAAIAVVLFSQFFDETKATLKQVDDAGIAPIVVQKEVARIQQESATADISAKKARVALLQQRAKVLRDQFDLLVQAEESRSVLTTATSMARVDDALLGAAGVPAGSPAKTTKKAHAEGSNPSGGVDDNQRLALWLAIGNYLRADAAQATLATIDLKLAASDRVAVLAYTEANINAWRSLIDAHVAQLVAWSKAGVKGSDITSTLQTIAAWWIAHGVNK